MSNPSAAAPGGAASATVCAVPSPPASFSGPTATSATPPIIIAMPAVTPTIERSDPPVTCCRDATKAADRHDPRGHHERHHGRGVVRDRAAGPGRRRTARARSRPGLRAGSGSGGGDPRRFLPSLIDSAPPGSLVRRLGTRGRRSPRGLPARPSGRRSPRSRPTGSAPPTSFMISPAISWSVSARCPRSAGRSRRSGTADACPNVRNDAGIVGRERLEEQVEHLPRRRQRRHLGQRRHHRPPHHDRREARSARAARSAAARN